MHDTIQIGQAPAGVIGPPVVGVPFEDDPLARRVLTDRERSGADDLGRFGVEAPEVFERARLDGALEEVLGVDGGAHRTQERSKRLGQDELDRVVAQRRHGHRRLIPLAGVRVQVAKLESGAARRVEVVVVDDSIEGEVDVVGGEGRPVVPQHVVSQVKHPPQAVVGPLPRFCQQWLDLIGQP